VQPCTHHSETDDESLTNRRRAREEEKERTLATVTAHTSNWLWTTRLDKKEEGGRGRQWIEEACQKGERGKKSLQV